MENAIHNPCGRMRDHRRTGSPSTQCELGSRATNVVNTVTDSIASEITANIEIEGFTVKLPCSGQFEVRHKEGKMQPRPSEAVRSAGSFR